MTLIDLEPQWMEHEGRRIGFVFLSPVQTVRSDGTRRNPPHRLTCMVAPTPMGIQREVAERMFGDNDYCVVPCNPACGWAVAGGIDAASFDTLSATPSIDGSASGDWHGHITNGQIVGGI